MPLKCCVPMCKIQNDDLGAGGVSFHSYVIKFQSTIFEVKFELDFLNKSYYFSRVPANPSTKARWIEILKNYNIEIKKH